MTIGQKRSFTVWKRSGLRVQMTFLVFVRDWVTSSLLAATKNYFSEARVVVYKRVPFSHNIHFLFFIHQIKPQSFICAITQLQFPPLVRKHDQKLCRENTISTFVYLILLNFRRNLYLGVPLRMTYILLERPSPLKINSWMSNRPGAVCAEFIGAVVYFGSGPPLNKSSSSSSYPSHPKATPLSYEKQI